MKKNMFLLLITIMLSGCFANTEDIISSDTKVDFTETNHVRLELALDPPPTFEPRSGEKIKIIQDIENINLEYYIDNSSSPEVKTSKTYPSAEIETIASLCIDYYINSGVFLDENGMPYELSSIKIYEISNRDDLIVITGEEFGLWPGCFIFTYKNNELTLFPDTSPFEIPTAIAEEIRLVYGQGFPFPIIEIFVYSHQNNGDFGLYRLNGEYFEPITGEVVTGYHYTGWKEARNHPIFDGIDFGASERAGEEVGEDFDCRYENGHLLPSYTDMNGDGYIDIVISGNFQCEHIDGNVLLSQEVKRVFLYDALQENFIFSFDLSIRSELEEYWCTNVTYKMNKWAEEQK